MRVISTWLNITRVRNHVKVIGNRRLFQDGRTVRTTRLTLFFQGYICITIQMEQYGGILDRNWWGASNLHWSGPCLDHYRHDVGTSQIGVVGGVEELIRKVKMDCDRQVVLESGGYRSTTWHTLRALQQVHGVEEILEIWDYTCVTSPPFFSQIDSVKILGTLESTWLLVKCEGCRERNRR